MNISHSNSTIYPGNILQLQITVIIVTLMQVVNFFIGIPLHIYIIMFLRRAGGLDESVFFTVSQSVSEIIYALSAPLYVLYVIFPSLVKGMPQQFFTFIGMIARLMFQCLVCVERYLAVVHPVTFLKFKPLKYRLFCLIVAWVYVLTCSVLLLYSSNLVFLDFFGSFYLIIVVLELLFCVSILKVLKQPSPGKRKDSGMSSTKKKAFRIVLINLLTHLIQMMPIIVILSLKSTLSFFALTVAASNTLVVNIGGGLMPPFFFLHRAGKLKLICRGNN